MNKENSQIKISRGQELLKELASIIKLLSDKEVAELLGSGLLDDFLTSILDPKDRKKSKNLQDFLLVNKYRSALLARLRLVITNNYSFRGTSKKGESGFISPYHLQWFDDGVMFLQGKKPFEGLIGCYRADNKVSYAIAAKDAGEGEMVGPEHFEFIEEKEWRDRHAALRNTLKIDNLEQPIIELEKLLNSSCNEESKYQQLLSKYGWALGAEYRVIERHSKLDDENIPDFTGQKVVDGTRDIIEIKPPYITLFKKSGEFNFNFNDAWNQAERYLNFVTQEKEYLLRNKGLKFENPLCRLIIGYALSVEQNKKLVLKQRMNPLIRISTYNDLLRYMRSTIELLTRLKQNASSQKKR